MLLASRRCLLLCVLETLQRRWRRHLFSQCRLHPPPPPPPGHALQPPGSPRSATTTSSAIGCSTPGLQPIPRHACHRAPSVAALNETSALQVAAAPASTPVAAIPEMPLVRRSFGNL
ncbi:hypothetical protein JDV02_002764 [Purpureocillium takamizusanense]|uniref:Uncharacterized protein n=1 Tax=Purpureocillium takamizusanense TaxID=2060973 RepID=A0A9Q8V959_9HYPO|nr:uncharacterized protein JDV02_002764 [Purpureocillium takamizusanense]UNI16326.1 hypothetical protein JDV02_002764 [Purpureocillium takamizusanense]